MDSIFGLMRRSQAYHEPDCIGNDTLEAIALMAIFAVGRMIVCKARRFEPAAAASTSDQQPDDVVMTSCFSITAVALACYDSKSCSWTNHRSTITNGRILSQEVIAHRKNVMRELSLALLSSGQLRVSLPRGHLLHSTPPILHQLRMIDEKARARDLCLQLSEMKRIFTSEGIDGKTCTIWLLSAPFKKGLACSGANWHQPLLQASSQISLLLAPWLDCEKVMEAIIALALIQSVDEAQLESTFAKLSSYYSIKLGPQIQPD
eukprot:TRINITY_DN51344_c0_g1_i1.p1 TRINITY_DN51344_c0_g1~~TRINITY_DN51344_c0_g1_i1.p1  ORF type:complete len:262 (+),score=21.26 TRINITY_DN51344_c0_g1_i1:255-1040(+)